MSTTIDRMQKENADKNRIGFSYYVHGCRPSDYPYIVYRSASAAKKTRSGKWWSGLR